MASNCLTGLLSSSIKTILGGQTSIGFNGNIEIREIYQLRYQGSIQLLEKIINSLVLSAR